MSSTEEREKEISRLTALDAGLSLYEMDEQGLAYMKAQTGIEDDEELKKHILAVRAEGYAVRLPPSVSWHELMLTGRGGVQIYPYPCLQRFSFLT